MHSERRQKSIAQRARSLPALLVMLSCSTFLGLKDGTVQGTCTTSAQCAPGYGCLLGVCRNNCDTDAECGVGSRCLKAIGSSACIPSDATCLDGCPRWHTLHRRDVPHLLRGRQPIARATRFAATRVVLAWISHTTRKAAPVRSTCRTETETQAQAPPRAAATHRAELVAERVRAPRARRQRPCRARAGASQRRAMQAREATAAAPAMAAPPAREAVQAWRRSWTACRTQRRPNVPVQSRSTAIRAARRRTWLAAPVKARRPPASPVSARRARPTRLPSAARMRALRSFCNAQGQLQSSSAACSGNAPVCPERRVRCVQAEQHAAKLLQQHTAALLDQRSMAERRDGSLFGRGSHVQRRQLHVHSNRVQLGVSRHEQQRQQLRRLRAQLP